MATQPAAVCPVLYQILHQKSSIDQHPENWVSVNWVDIMALNDTATNLNTVLLDAARVVIDLARSSEAASGRRPETWNAIIRWSTLVPVPFAITAVSMQTLCILIADAFDCIFRIRKLQAMDYAELVARREAKPLRAVEIKTEPDSEGKPRVKREPEKREAEPQAQPQPELKKKKKKGIGEGFEAQVAAEEAPVGAATQFISQFCHHHNFYELAEHAPTWSDIAFIAGCRSEHTWLDRMTAAIPDLLGALDLAICGALALAEAVKHGIADSWDGTYQFAQQYIDKWSLLTEQAAAGGHNQVSAWRDALRWDPYGASRFLCITIADACRDVVDLRPHARAKVDSGDPGTLMGFDGPAITASVPSVQEQLAGHSVSHEKSEAREVDVKTESGGEGRGACSGTRLGDGSKAAIKKERE